MYYIKINNWIFRRSILMAAPLLFLVVSCKVGQNYKRPDLELPEKYRDKTAITDTSSIADIKWQQYFTDPSLQVLITKGIKYNYDQQIALKRVSAAMQTLKQAKVLQLPELNLGIMAQTSNPSNNSFTGISISSFLGQQHIEDYNVAFSLSWEADIWGKIRSHKEVALAEYLQTYEASKAIKTQIVAGIAQGYYNLLMLDEQLSIANKNLVIADSTLYITKIQRDAGEATTLAVQQAEAQKQSNLLLIPQLQQNIAIQENALSILVGEYPEYQSRGNVLFNSEIPKWDSPGLPAKLLGKRPDVRAKEMSLMASNARIGVAKGNMYPTFAITAQGGLNSYLVNNWYNLPGSLFGTLIGGITQPVFNRRKLKTEYEITKIKRDEAELEFKQSILSAVGEVSDALITTEKLKEQKIIAEVQVISLNEAIKNAKLLYRAGMANYLEVLTAQTNVLQSELNLAYIHRLQLGASVDLYRSLGGGW